MFGDWSCPPRDCAVSLLLVFKTRPLSQTPSMGCHIPRKGAGQGSCAAPLGPCADFAQPWCYTTPGLLSHRDFTQVRQDSAHFLGWGQSFPTTSGAEEQH